MSAAFALRLSLPQHEKRNFLIKQNWVGKCDPVIPVLSNGYKRKPVQGAEKYCSLRRVSIWEIIIYRFYSCNDCRFAKP